MEHTKDEEILALKAAIKYMEFASKGECCPYCGCHRSHSYCPIDGLLRPEAAETFKDVTGMTVIHNWIWMVNNDEKYAFLKSSPPSVDAQKLEDLEVELATLERDVLPDLQKSLDRLEDPNYSPADNPDHALRDQDIAYLCSEISIVQRRIAQIKAIQQSAATPPITENGDL